MNGVAHLKGLADLRTSISVRSRSSSRHKGTPYLEILSLGMDKLRLEGEMALLLKRRERVQGKLAEIRQLMQDRLTEVQEDAPSDPSSLPSEDKHTAQRVHRGSHQWRTVAMEY